jgi:hypothetical protein
MTPQGTQLNDKSLSWAKVGQVRLRGYATR